MEPGEVAGVAADLVGVVHHDRGELEAGVGVHGADRGPADVAGAPDDG